MSVLFGLGDPGTAAGPGRPSGRGGRGGGLPGVGGRAWAARSPGRRPASHRIASDGWIVAGFEHRTSRADDPQLHTHLVVPNLLHGADGKWSAVDAKEIYRHALTASYLYHAVLREQLTHRLGLAWTAPVKGVAEIDGIPPDLLGEFSTRRRQILTAMDAAGSSGPDAAQAACLATRPGKSRGVHEETLRDRWTARATAAGHRPRALVGKVMGKRRPPPPPPVDRLAAYLLGPAGLTAQATGFDRRDLLQAICQALPAGRVTDRASLEALADRVLESRDVVRLVAPPEDGPRWTTTELLGVEQTALSFARDLTATPARDVPPEQLTAAMSGRTLSGEQQQMIEALAAADGLAVVVGPAGAGKTAALAAATHAWTAQGRAVTGAAVAAVTARRLEHATGIASTSLTRLLDAARRTDPATGLSVGLPRGGVLVVDEASMVDTRTLTRLLRPTRAASGTLVLVGNPAQLPEVGAGGLFTALARHPKPSSSPTTGDRSKHGSEPRWRPASRRPRGWGSRVRQPWPRPHRASRRLARAVVEDYLRHLDTANQPQRPGHPGPAGQRAGGDARRPQGRRQPSSTTPTRAWLLTTGQLGPDAVTTGQGDQALEYWGR